MMTAVPVLGPKDREEDRHDKQPVPQTKDDSEQEYLNSNN
jgi:hypothetical protein